MGRSEHFSAGASETYRNATPAPPDRFGVKHVPANQAPKEVVANVGLLGPNNDKHGQEWSYSKTETISPTTPIQTTQPSVGVEHVLSYAKRLKEGAKTPVDFKHPKAVPEDQDNGRPRLIRHDGQLWHVDGLHRIGAALSKGRSFKARVIDILPEEQKTDYGKAPRGRYDVVQHLSYDHMHDNEMVNSDTHHDDDWSDSDLHGYHASLHEHGVADHRHS